MPSNRQAVPHQFLLDNFPPADLLILVNWCIPPIQDLYIGQIFEIVVGHERLCQFLGLGFLYQKPKQCFSRVYVIDGRIWYANAGKLHYSLYNLGTVSADDYMCLKAVTHSKFRFRVRERYIQPCFIVGTIVEEKIPSFSTFLIF